MFCVFAVMKMIDCSCAAETEDPSEASVISEGQHLRLLFPVRSSSLFSIEGRGKQRARSCLLFAAPRSFRLIDARLKERDSTTTPPTLFETIAAKPLSCLCVYGSRTWHSINSVLSSASEYEEHHYDATVKMRLPAVDR